MSTPTAAPRPTSPPAPEPPQRADRPTTGRLVLGGLLVLLGLTWLAEVTGLFTVRWQTVLSAVVLGIGLLLLATAGRRHADGLIGLGVVLSVVLVLVSVVPGVAFRGGVGDRVHRPTAMVELQDRYELGAGNLQLDLRDVQLPPGSTAVAVEVGMGELVVRVPRDAAVEVTASTGAGDLDVLGRTASGLGQRVTHADPEGPTRLRLDLSTGLGSIEVTR